MENSSESQQRPRQAQQYFRRAGCVSLFESIRDGFLGLDERFRAQCSDEPRKSKQRVTQVTKRMTSTWGPSHTLDEDDYTALSPPLEEWQPCTPDALKEKGSDHSTPDTVESTPERDERSRGPSKIQSRGSASGSNASYSIGYSSYNQNHQYSNRLSKIVESASAAVSSGMHAIKETRDPNGKFHFNSFHGSCAPFSLQHPLYDSEKASPAQCGAFCECPDGDCEDTSFNALGRRKQRHLKHRSQNSLSQQKQDLSTRVQTDKSKQNSSHQNVSTHAGTNLNTKKRTTQASPPIESISFKNLDRIELSDSISELTMQSNNAHINGSLQDSRRMAYYAVGKHHGSSGRGKGNRRCYFSGKLIGVDIPFYAGGVQQGLRTLVVFCLPRSIGLPKSLPRSSSSRASSSSKRRPQTDKQRLSHRKINSTYSQESSLLDHNQILDEDSSVSSDVDLANIKDPSLESDLASISLESTSFYDVDEDNSQLRLSKSPELRDYLLQSLPEPSQDLLDEMQSRYPDQFLTLPIQVRSPACWRLYVRFCFFSGLPIAEGELHYKVKDEVVKKVYSEEIVLSHEVMETVNGEDSAGILRLPNTKTFNYLKKHYELQCGKLSEEVFDRKSWDIVLAEV